LGFGFRLTIPKNIAKSAMNINLTELYLLQSVLHEKKKALIPYLIEVSTTKHGSLSNIDLNSVFIEENGDVNFIAHGYCFGFFEESFCLQREDFERLQNKS
jgi:hypothetical protein